MPSASVVPVQCSRASTRRRASPNETSPWRRSLSPASQGRQCPIPHAHAQVFGNSPDETAHCRLSLNKESVQEAVVMIQPSLQAYSFPAEGMPIEPEPVSLPVPAADMPD